jgi:negative regulator of flagellin synthesis FlgM
MKIGPQDLSAYADTTGAATGRNSKTGADTRAALIRAGTVAGALGAAADGATVKISNVAAGAMMATNAGPDVDLEKVRQVQAALAQGTYKVNPEAIADELIASAQALLKPKA